jgi:general secretion pathway protein N
LISAWNSRLTIGPPSDDRRELLPAICACVLLLALGLQFILPFSTVQPELSALAPRRVRPVAPPGPPQFAAVLAHPVFAPDRQPGAAELSAVGAGPLGGYAALGVAIGRGVATAVISGPGAAARTVRMGESVEGWRLVAVDRVRLTFERDGARQSLVVGAPPAVLSKAAKQPGGAEAR